MDTSWAGDEPVDEVSAEPVVAPPSLWRRVTRSRTWISVAVVAGIAIWSDVFTGHRTAGMITYGVVVGVSVFADLAGRFATGRRTTRWRRVVWIPLRPLYAIGSALLFAGVTWCLLIAGSAISTKERVKSHLPGGPTDRP